jgi:hypothetical protein
VTALSAPLREAIVRKIEHRPGPGSGKHG